MRQILDRLMVSSLSEANDPFFLERNKVQSILYYGDGGMFPDDIKLYHRKPGADGLLDPEMLEDGIAFLRESLVAGRRVLAVGPNGATIVAAYLAEMGFGMSQALELVAKQDTPAPDEDTLKRHSGELNRRSTVSLRH